MREIKNTLNEIKELLEKVKTENVTARNAVIEVERKLDQINSEEFIDELISRIKRKQLPGLE